MRQIVVTYLRNGLLHRPKPGKLQFTLPLLRIAVGMRVYSCKVPYMRVTTFKDFILRSLERMESSTLKNSLSKGIDDHLIERAWQMEWYRAAYTVVPENVTISPDVGTVFGCAGELDFYVNGDLNWGIELLREGDRQSEHVRRFEKDGEYHKILPFLKEWVILDFRHKSKRTRGEKNKHLWQVFYNDDMTEFTINIPNMEEQKLKLGMNLSLPEENVVSVDFNLVKSSPN